MPDQQAAMYELPFTLAEMEVVIECLEIAELSGEGADPEEIIPLWERFHQATVIIEGPGDLFEEEAGGALGD